MKTEEKTQHTPEPWEFVPAETFEDGSVFPPHIVGGSRQLMICEFDQVGFELDVMVESETDRRSAQANARRIVAAVNACEGISTEDLEGGVIDKMMRAYQGAIAAMRKAKGAQ